MSVRIQIDQPQTHFTNLDFLTGKVIVHLVTDAAISAVTVKLEGESRTRLSGPKLGYNSSERPDKKRTELEWHKLLYRVETLFPNRETQQPAGNGSYMLQAGHYEYPFRFKFPFNNDCQKNNMVRDLKVGGMGIAFNPDLNVKHVKRTLPPSLSGFPGEAEIRYYVKATVVRPKFYQENIRSQVDIKFLPIEPPRPPDRQQETFARRTQQFARSFNPELEKKGLFPKNSIPADPPEPPSFQVDARLPNPAIITCNDRLPLRILVQKLIPTTQTVYLSMLQIELIGYTHVRAHDLNRSESRSWVIMSKSNMNIPLGDSSDPVGKEWKVPSRYWENIPLPNTVAPSFDTCNISRTYELEVRIGLSHGGGSDSIKPELIVVPLRLRVKIFSGIAPPAALLQRIATSHLHHPPESVPHPISPGLNLPFYPPPTPMSPSYSQHPIPAPTGHFHPPHPPSGTIDDDDAPPSYEDAMADEIAPVDGPRRDYSVPTPSSADRRDDGGFGPDSKGNGGGGASGISGLGRRVSERLFPQNGVGIGMGRRGQSDYGHSRHSSAENEIENETTTAGGGGALGGQPQQQERGREPPPPPPRIVRKPTLPPSFEESMSTGTNNEGGGGAERR